MAKVANPHKQFQFSIFLYGMNPFLAQKVTTPDRELDKIEHGEGNHVIKTAGMVRIGELTVEKISSASLADNLIWGWIALIQNEYSGGGVIPDVYKKAIQVQRLATDGVTVLNTWSYTGAWPSKINGTELDRTSSDNTIQSIEFCVDGEVFL
jgi:phage tail-like protein